MKRPQRWNSGICQLFTWTVPTPESLSMMAPEARHRLSRMTCVERLAPGYSVVTL